MERIIEFNTAKLAKEKGFNIQDELVGSHHYFYKSDKSLISGDNFAKQLLYHAPTQSVLQTWLRDNFRIHVSVNPWKDEMSYVNSDEVPNEGFQVLYEGNVINIDDDWNTFSNFSHYTSYEECLENLLIEALKLIQDKK
jgi:hypothetical protein